jgi:putative acetyltransferase
MSEITFSDVSPYSPEALQLVEEMWFDLGALYGNMGPCQFKPEDVDHARGAFIIALLDGVPAGCGVIRPLETDDGEDAAEVKRMFVRPDMRRRGVARGILAVLEERACGLDYTVVRLETGTLQPEAIALYESQGYTRITCYGPYATDPMSVCYEKRLS